MKCPLIFSALVCVVLHGTASAQEKPPAYRIAANAFQFDAANNTYSFEIRFFANPCPDVTYNIPFSIAGMKDSEEAVNHFKPQIDKIAGDLANDRKRCSSK